MKIKSIIATGSIAFVLIACGKKEILDEIMVSGVENPEISLNGTWKFSMNPPDLFWENEINTEDWADIVVPGECAMQGFAIKHDHPYAYRYDFFVPEDFKDKQIFLNFNGVYSFARVWLNGQFVREHYGGFTKWECDITDFVKTGEKARLTVEVIDRVDDISYGSGYAKHQIGGILRDVELVALPELNFKQLYFETDLDENYQNAELRVFYELNQAADIELEIEVFNTENELIARIENDTLIKSGPYINLKMSGKRVQYSTIVMDDLAKHWQCEAFNYEVNDGILHLYTSGKYDNLSVSFYIQIDENGTIITEYRVNDAPEGNWIQES